MGVTALVFAAELQKVRTTFPHVFSPIIEKGLGEFRNGMYVEGGRRHEIILFFRICMEISQLGRNVIRVALKWKLKWDSTLLTSTIEVLRKKVELSNTRTAYVMHIPNTLSIISARINHNLKFL